MLARGKEKPVCSACYASRLIARLESHGQKLSDGSLIVVQGDARVNTYLNYGKLAR